MKTHGFQELHVGGGSRAWVVRHVDCVRVCD